MADREDRARITKSIQDNGQLEEIVTLDGMVLDGRNRQDILIDDLKREPMYVDWTKLPENLTKNGPLAYVMARNMDRRHLTAGQKAMAAAEYKKLFEKEAEERQVSGLKQNAGPSAPIGANGDEFSQDNGSSPADESQVPVKRGRGRPRKNPVAATPAPSGKTSDAAGKLFGVSGRSVDRASSILKKSPKKAAAVKAGKMSLNKAERDEKKESAKRQEYDTAVKRIASVMGRDTSEIMKKRKRSEVFQLAGMSDDDMLKIRGVINHGWSVAKSAKYKMTALSRTHSIGDLCTRALVHGVAKSGTFSLEIVFEGVELEIDVRKKK